MEAKSGKVLVICISTTIMCACVCACRSNRVDWHDRGETVIQKSYLHILDTNPLSWTLILIPCLDHDHPTDLSGFMRLMIHFFSA